MERVLACLLISLLGLLLVAVPGGKAVASPGTGRGVEQRLVSSWLGVVDGEVRTRTLTITGLRPGPEETILANAGYGLTGGDILPVRCAVTVGAEGTMLSVAGFYGDRLDVREVADGWFVGTYTYKDGRETSITLGRIWDEDLPKNQFSLTADARITLVYFGAEDCPESAAWEREGKEAFLNSREHGYVDFRVIKRPIHNRCPAREDFPDDLQWLYDDAEAGGVSPYFVVAVDQTVVLRTYGLNNWDRKVKPLLKQLSGRKQIALSHPLEE
jgi:hypothetical protein